MKTKLIIIDTHEDYIRFIKKLRIYKSLFFIRTNFKLKNSIDKSDLKDICIALNIKNRRKRIEYIYDQACELIDSQNRNIDICGFENNKCYIQRKINNGKYNGCCKWCLYQTKNGCVLRI